MEVSIAWRFRRLHRDSAFVHVKCVGDGERASAPPIKQGLMFRIVEQLLAGNLVHLGLCLREHGFGIYELKLLAHSRRWRSAGHARS
jgi:hypothetical protein